MKTVPILQEIWDIKDRLAAESYICAGWRQRQHSNVALSRDVPNIALDRGDIVNLLDHHGHPIPQLRHFA